MVEETQEEFIDRMAEHLTRAALEDATKEQLLAWLAKVPEKNHKLVDRILDAINKRFPEG